MSLYALALFAHIVGVLGLFLAIGLLWTAIQVNGFTALGVVFMMTIKPNLVGSLVTLVVAVVLGVVAARLWRPRLAATPVKKAQFAER